MRHLAMRHPGPCSVPRPIFKGPGEHYQGHCCEKAVHVKMMQGLKCFHVDAASSKLGISQTGPLRRTLTLNHNGPFLGSVLVGGCVALAVLESCCSQFYTAHSPNFLSFSFPWLAVVSGMWFHSVSHTQHACTGTCI